MPLFDLGEEITISRRVAKGRSDARALARAVLKSYAPLGYEVSLTDGGGDDLSARVTDASGTAVDVGVALGDAPGGTQIVVRLGGSVFVGGVQGMMANSALVRSAAADQLERLVGATFGPEPRPAQNDGVLKDKLDQLTEAYEANLLTDEEFEKKREELLRDR